jgi:hypothetical protein
MPWKHNGRIIKVGRSWVDDNKIRHPSNWMIWSDSAKKDKGLVWEDPPKSEAPFDDRFYSGRQADGTLIEKNLTDVNVVDENGKAVLGLDGNQLVQKGIKNTWIAQTKQTANDLLSNTDWMITRKAEKGTAIPDATTKYRDSVRTACNTIETKINACSNLTEFMALFDAPVDSDKVPTGNAPIFDFPEETSE